ncbi:TPA: hypothetical protein ACQ49P_005761 [Pseudomonas aeruginosa]
MSIHVDGVATLKAALGGALQGIAKRMSWDEAEVARQMKASLNNASNLLGNELGRIPLDALIDMCMECGITFDMRLELPERFFQ